VRSDFALEPAAGNGILRCRDRNAIELNRAWDRVRAGHVSAPARTTLKVYPKGSIGDGYKRAMELRKADRTPRASSGRWSKRSATRGRGPGNGSSPCSAIAIPHH
jgi:hypothetical protein